MFGGGGFESNYRSGLEGFGSTIGPLKQQSRESSGGSTFSQNPIDDSVLVVDVPELNKTRVFDSEANPFAAMMQDVSETREQVGRIESGGQVAGEGLTARVDKMEPAYGRIRFTNANEAVGVLTLAATVPVNVPNAARDIRNGQVARRQRGGAAVRGLLDAQCLAYQDSCH